MSSKKILLSGGGTGGHIIPILAVVSEIRKLCRERKIENPEFVFLCPKSGFNKYVLKENITLREIEAGKLRRYFSLKNATDVFKTFIGIIQSLRYMQKFKPDVVFCKGGFASFPAVVAAWIKNIPIIIHESDIVPGFANKTVSFFADKILVSFEETRKYFPSKKVIVTGNPLRSEILNGRKEKGIEIFSIKENIPTILIFGGSQGAKTINNITLNSLNSLIKKYQIIHICGEKNYNEVAAKIKMLPSRIKRRYKLYPYIDKEMKEVYSISDVVVSRAGSNALSEIIALEKPSIVIPISKSANNHQFRNAEFFAKKESLTLIKEENLTSKNLEYEISKLLDKSNIKYLKKKINNIRKEINSFGAAKKVAEEVLKFEK